jgi:TadE-like protein
MDKRKLTHLLRDESGVSLVEFALISPVMFGLLLGALDIGHSLYMRSAINGALQIAGRSSSLEGAAVTSEQSRIDNYIAETVHTLAPSASVVVKRRYYKTFSEAALAEAENWDDNNDNQTCDEGEPYVDGNNNEAWDEDGGNDGQGGARDVVIITAEVKYDRLFPMHELIGLSDQAGFTSDSILANQPYGEQNQYGTPQVRTCDD